MRKLRPLGSPKITASKWQNLGSNPGSLAPGILLSTRTHHKRVKLVRDGRILAPAEGCLGSNPGNTFEEEEMGLLCPAESPEPRWEL